MSNDKLKEAIAKLKLFIDELDINDSRFVNSIPRLQYNLKELEKISMVPYRRCDYKLNNLEYYFKEKIVFCPQQGNTWNILVFKDRLYVEDLSGNMLFSIVRYFNLTSHDKANLYKRMKEVLAENAIEEEILE